MFGTYFVKQDLPGLRKGSVERFSLIAGARWQQEGAVEPYDGKNKRHVEALSAQEKSAEQHRQAEDEKLAREFAARKA